MKKTITGKIIEVRTKPDGSGFPDSYVIKLSGMNKTCLAHVGDLKANEDFLYKQEKIGKIEILQEGDEVKFETVDNLKVMHVRRAA